MLLLEVHATQHAARGGRLVVLHELAVYATRNEVGALVGFHKVPAAIAVGLYVNNNNALDGGGGKGKVSGCYGGHLC